jgi:2-polyprenyl-6-methoxyphenol hydroxylase-like FAD-dependent oxidoreductase
VYWFATASVPAGTATSDEPAEVLRRFGAWHDPIPALLAATRGQDVLRHDINDLAGPLGSFVHGRVVLIGDAAHAMTPDLGQGGCQAIEDAVTLIALLNASTTGSAADGAIEGALTRYDEQRRRRTQPLAARARTVGRVGQLSSRVGVGVRNGVLALVPGSAFVRASTSVQRWDPVQPV